MKNQKKERSLEYKVFTVRLSDENISWLKLESKKHKSWNIFFKQLIQKYGHVPMHKMPRK